MHSQICGIKLNIPGSPFAVEPAHVRIIAPFMIPRIYSRLSGKTFGPRAPSGPREVTLLAKNWIHRFITCSCHRLDGRIVISRNIQVRKSLVILRRRRRWLDVLQLLDEASFQKVELDTVCYNVVLSTCKDCQCWAQALFILEQMELRGPWPSVVSYSTAIASCESSTRWPLAVALFNRTLERGLQADSILISATASACGKAQQWHLALHLALSMKAWNVDPAVAALNTTISAFGRLWERALQLFDGMDQSGVQPDVVSYGAAAQTCDRASRWGEEGRGQNPSLSFCRSRHPMMA